MYIHRYGLYALHTDICICTPTHIYMYIVTFSHLPRKTLFHVQMGTGTRMFTTGMFLTFLILKTNKETVK